MDSARSFLGYLLLTALALLLVAGVVAWRCGRVAFAHFFLRPRHSVRGWCAVARG